MSMEDRCDIDDCKIKLYRYSIVSIRRGHERIVLPLDEVLVKTPLDQCDFDTWVIAKFVRKNPDVPARWLRVCSTLVCTWDKQPLHYHEKQLDYLRSIAHSVGKMQPEEDDEEPEAIEAIG